MGHGDRDEKKDRKEKKERKRDRDDEDPNERANRKERKKAEKVAKLLGYTNDVNPFGDSNLLQPFVWGKKIEKDKFAPNKARQDSHSIEGGRLEMLNEIEKVRKRRKDREDELEELERLRGEEQRLREAAEFGDWQRKEEDFLLEQTKERSRIRLVEKREKPIDLIAKNILLVEAAFKDRESADPNFDSKNSQLLLELDVEIRNPVDLVEDLYEDELEQLITDLEAYLALELKKSKESSSSAGGNFTLFYQSLLYIAMKELRTIQQSSKSKAGGRSSSSGFGAEINAKVLAEIKSMLEGKSSDELEDLQEDIKKSLKEGKSSDVAYWETMQAEVKLQLARQFVQETHIDLLQKQLEILSEMRAEVKNARLKEQLLNPSKEAPEAANARLEEENKLLSAEKRLTGGDDAVDLDEKMDGDDEVLLPGSTYWWHDKYRPRKPRYLNRVKTGWDWNKYNQTHYDFDNPPPKVIQGYKFTIFYPDLIDKTKTPTYVVEPCTDGNDFVILRFKGGPPYEDVAFKIINKQWDTHKKSGFRCTFDRGVLQIHVNFMRSFYRR